MDILILFKGGVETQEYFSVVMSKTFEKLGNKIYWYDLMLQQESARLLKEFYMTHRTDRFTAFTFNFNGIAGEPGLYYDSVNYNFWDEAGIPVINMVVDHPLYYHKYMKYNPCKYVQICIDKNHVKYMKRFFKDVGLYSADGFLPLAGTELNSGRIIIPDKRYLTMQERPIDVIFTGNYTPMEELEKHIQHMGNEYKELYHSIIDDVIASPQSLVEDVAERRIKEAMGQLSDRELMQCMPSMMFVDLSVRFYFRWKVVKEVADSGVNICILGAGWDKLQYEHPDNVVCLGNVDSQKCLEMISQSKISLNVMPWFKDGAHDRVFNSMLNGAVCVSDESVYLSEEFTHGQDICFYNLENIKALPNIINDLLQDKEKMQDIADRAYCKCIEKHTWEKRAVKIDEFIKKYGNIK